MLMDQNPVRYGYGCETPRREPRKLDNAPVRGRKETTAMDKDRIAGAAKEAKGAAKVAIGKATGDAKLQTDGKADEAEGKVQNAVGGLKDAARDALNK